MRRGLINLLALSSTERGEEMTSTKEAGMLQVLNGCDYCDDGNGVVVKFGGSGNGVSHYICRDCAAVLLASFEEPMQEMAKS